MPLFETIDFAAARGTMQERSRQLEAIEAGRRDVTAALEQYAAHPAELDLPDPASVPPETVARHSVFDGAALARDLKAAIDAQLQSARERHMLAAWHTETEKQLALARRRQADIIKLALLVAAILFLYLWIFG